MIIIFLELAYVTGGNAIQNLAGKKEWVKEGDYFIIDYGAVHSYQECKNFTLINCLFLPEAIDDVLEGCHSLEEMLRICMIRYYRKAFEQEKTANRIFHITDDVQLRTSEHRSMYSYVRLSIDRMYSYVRPEHRSCYSYVV